MSGKGASDTHDDLMEAIKKLKTSAVQAVGEANALSMRAEGYELYASFPAYVNLMTEQQRRITVLYEDFPIFRLRKVLRNAGCRSVVPMRIDDLDELLERVVEANDSICDRAGILLDSLQRAGSLEEVVVPQHVLDAESTAAAAGSALSLFERQGRYAGLLQRLQSHHKDSPAVLSAQSLLPVVKEKPQVVYGIQVDNSNSVFKPKLREKHHAQEMQPENLKIIDNDADPESIPARQLVSGPIAPLKKLSDTELVYIPARQLVSGPVAPLKKLSDTELIYVDTAEKLANLRDILNSEKEFSVDLEVCSLHQSDSK
ncbi:unnamed protein product [Gongylonema pulchrum]|uniref:PMC2NT domain-containing protein n=1 Tax=Gongylonema pulchrum TaxID=637853 RepID=A0A183DPF1_9BILA|nr:unnamed protein product [Gongylonema pulchrum]